MTKAMLDYMIRDTSHMVEILADGSIKSFPLDERVPISMDISAMQKYSSTRITRLIKEAKRILRERTPKIENSRPKHRPIHKFIYAKGIL